MHIVDIGALPVPLHDEGEVFHPELAMVVHPSPEDLALVDPNSSQNKMFNMFISFFKDQGKKIEEINNKLEATEKANKQLKDAFVKTKEALDQELLHQAEVVEELGQTIVELNKTISNQNLLPAREDWIKKNIDEVSAYILGGGLGATAGVYGFGAMAIMGVQVPFSLPVIIGANRGFSFMRSIGEKNLRERLTNLEEEYLAANPHASKKDAFEHAKGVIELAKKEKKSDDYDSWSGLDYSVS